MTANLVPMDVVTSSPSTDATRESVVRAEPVGFGEHFGRSGGVQQLDAVEDNDHHRARCCSGISHPPIVSVSVGKMADRP